MRDDSRVWARGAVLAAGLLVGIGFSISAARGAEGGAGGQWKLAEAGTTCFNLIVEQPVTGPRISVTRQTLQETAGSGDVYAIAEAGGHGLSVGERLEVVRNTGVIRHPVSDEPVGDVLEVIGVVEVVDTNETTALLHIEGVCRELELGDYLRPLAAEAVPEDLPRLPVFNASALVEPEEADAFLVLAGIDSVMSEGAERTRESVTKQETFAQRDLVLIDQGSNAGWRLADLALIYRDRILGLSTLGDPEQVPILIGRGVVVHADATSAVVQIVDSPEEMHLGDRARRIGSAYEYVNHPPTISCRAERQQVRSGESVRLTVIASDPDGDPTMIEWQASAGTLSASEGASVTWTAADLAEGVVSLTAIVDDGREDGRVECGLGMTVAPAPVAGGGAVGGRVTPGAPQVLDLLCPEFPSGSTTVDNRCKAILDDVALRMRQNPQATARITGHSDTTGAAQGNQAISLQRAENARAYLVGTHGIEASRIEVAGAGSSQPIAPNDTPEGQLRNRRVEIRVTLPGGEH